MQINRLNLRNVVAIVACLAAVIMSASCEKESNRTEKSLVGKWVTSDYHAGDNDTIVFKEDFCVEKYFDYFANQENHSYVTYSLSGNEIRFITAFSYTPPEILEYIPVIEAFELVLNGKSLTIKGFSNPFSNTKEMRRDVRFTKIK